ncbi:MAG: Oligopeptide-binding protein AppA [Alphaproteobacteria bacterium MarineAlpha5_Bin6]|nr:MAG: Oligopeptide-binding protein AppA [Alphaproteobacteria bacterium MarineAlpha5_Bin7]PPR53817.1 MAG: Oligopeptide-binding protein AppA [Alphaproteobacteria bacterium MarineAlpha5_Bin6]|tara:strand:- start:765 stop:2558 length:1794 start_codon:yes stop_codon:yes gene_type:complete
MYKLLIFVSTFLFFENVYAQKMHGIAMHGIPKYDSNFTHLTYVNPNAPKGGNLKFGVYGSFDNLNRVAFKGSKAAGLGYINDTLMRRVWDEAFTLYGLIAEHAEMPEDRSSITFFINPEARFHDGSAITRDDVLFSLETFQTKGTPNQKKTYGKVLETEMIGENGIKMNFINNEDKELPLIIAGFLPIIPKKYYEKLDVTKTFLDIPLGSGPYTIDEIDPGRKITYSRVKDYWAKDLPVNKGHYNFDTLTYDYYKDSNVLLEAFKVGDYDYRREYNAQRWQTNYDFPAIDRGDVILKEMKNDRPTGMNALVMNSRKEIFSNPRVREALSYAYDHEWINKILYNNAYTRTDSYFDNSPLASSGLPTEEELVLLEPWKDQLPNEIFNKIYKPPISDGSGMPRENLRIAKKILEEEGWKIENGKLTKDNKEFVFEFLIVSPSVERIALAFQKTLETLGITMNVRTVDSSQYQARMLNYDFDMIKNTWRVSLSPGNEQQFYWGSEVGKNDGSKNYAGVDSPVVDFLIEKLIGAKTREELTTTIHALDRVLLWGHYVIPLYHSGIDRIAYWDFLEYPDNIPLYGIVIESWWANKEKALILQN